MKAMVVVGNPKPASRTRLVAEKVAQRIVGADAPFAPTVDLCDYASELFTWPNEGLARINESVANSDIVVFASPTYKAAYTGMLKAFLDRYPNCGLDTVVAIPVMTGASMQHALAVDTSLRPLLVELGACVPTQGLYFDISRMAQVDAVVDRWAERNRSRALESVRVRSLETEG